MLALFPSPLASERKSAPIVDVVVPSVLRDYDIHYDILAHTIAFVDRTPSYAIKEAISVLFLLVSVFFVVRLMRDDTYTMPFYHWGVLVVSTLTVLLGLLSRTGSLASLWFQISTATTVAVHLAVEAYRFHVHLFGGRAAVNLMQQIDLKPDMAVILTAMIIASFTIASHSLLVIPCFISLFYSVKTVSETVNARWVERKPASLAYILCVVVDIAYTLMLWHFVVWEFMNQSLASVWYSQELLLITVTLAAGVYTAHLRAKSTIFPAIAVGCIHTFQRVLDDPNTKLQ
jgi:hypothetical protein